MITGTRLFLALGNCGFSGVQLGQILLRCPFVHVAGGVVPMTRDHFPTIKVHLVDAIRITKDLRKIKKRRARYIRYYYNNTEKMQKKNRDYYKLHRDEILESRKKSYSSKKLILMTNAVSGPASVI